MTCKEWRDGYSVGFDDGYKKAKRDLTDDSFYDKKILLEKFGIWFPDDDGGSDASFEQTFKDSRGKLSYTVTTNWNEFNSDWMSGRNINNTSLNEVSHDSNGFNSQWGVWFPVNSSEKDSIPDGLSYEEIYGSVVYHQNNKKENR